MQKRESMSRMDIQAYVNGLRRNPKYTEEILTLVESDLQYGLTIGQTEMYTSKRYDIRQMKVISKCLRNEYPEEVRTCITKDGLTGEQMEVALEFYESGGNISLIDLVIQSGVTSAHAMKKLFGSITEKVQQAQQAAEKENAYSRELLEQIKMVVEKIELQEKWYDILNEKLKEIQTIGQEKEQQKNLLTQIREQETLLAKQQEELNEARISVKRLQKEMKEMQKERERLQEIVDKTDASSSDKDMKENDAKSPEHVANGVVMKEEETKIEKGFARNIAIVDEQGKVVSVLQTERIERKNRDNFLTALFSRLMYKKNLDIVKMVAEKNLNAGQLTQIRYAIKKGLTEKQLLILINSQKPAEQMKEIIDIAVYENMQKRGEK